MAYQHPGQGQRPPQDPYGHAAAANRRPMSFYHGDDTLNGAATANGVPPPDADYPNPLPHRATSSAQRYQDELFTAPPPPPPRQTTHSYQPAQYGGSPVASPTCSSQGSPSAMRQPMPPLPYNPMDYAVAEQGLHRQGSIAGYAQHGFSPGYPTHSAHVTMPPMPSAGTYQPHQSYRQNSVFSSHAYPQSTGASPYSPQRAHQANQPPPLPAIPSSDSPEDDWQDSRRDPSRLSSARGRYGEEELLTANHGSISLPPAYGGRHSREEHALPPTPGPPPPPHGFLSEQEPYSYQSRPLPRVPSDSSSTPGDYFLAAQRPGRIERRSTEALTAQADIENEITGMLSSQSPRGANNRHAQNGGYETDDTDPEATAGLEAMREAERQEAEDVRRLSHGQRASFGYHPPAMHDTMFAEPSYEEDSDGDVPYVDLGSMGGGFDAQMSYGGGIPLRNGSRSSANDGGQPVSSSGSIHRSGTHTSSEMRYDDNGNTLQPFPAFTAARVDALGSGGLVEPSQFRIRRDSYDEGDDIGFQDTMTYQGYGEPPDMFYHPGIVNRPLPPPSAGEIRHNHSHSHNTALTPNPTNWRNPPADFSGYSSSYQPSDYYTMPPPGPNRHTSLVSHTSTPQTLAPIRAKTDAEERRRREQRASGTFEGSGTPSGGASAVALDLPTLEKTFNPSKLRTRDFDRCREPWALSEVAMWLKSIAEGAQYLKKQPLVDALVLLFTCKIPTLNIADAETLGASIVDGLESSGVLRSEEEWLVFAPVAASGVIFQLTGFGCYSPRVHDQRSSLRCYSHHCQRTEKKIDLSSQPGLKSEEDWATYYQLKKEDLEGHDKKEIERQNILHELVQKEESYLRELDVLRTLYRDRLRSANPPILPPKKIDSFLAQVFGKVDMVKKANEDHLLPQMKYRQKEQGPWIVGFSDILREWIRKARSAYIEYASSYPNAVYRIRQELERNMLFRDFLGKVQADPLSRRLDWGHYLKVPITRLQQVGLLLDTVMRRSMNENDEKRNLEIAINEIKAVTHECDARVGEGQRKADLTDLQYKLQLRTGMQGRVELNLDHLGRELVHKGDLLRIGTSKFTWLETHAILFDHYLVLAKTIQIRSAQSGPSFEKYDVSRLPIPMDLLVLESRDDPPVIRSTLTGRAGVAKVAPAEARVLRGSTSSSPAPGQVQHRDTSASLTSLTSLATVKSNSSSNPGVTTLDTGASDKILYPFRIKHLGQETYTLYAPSETARDDWCDKIINAKTAHAAALFRQNAEPFKLRVIADSAFSYEGSSSTASKIIIKGTPLDRAIREVETKFKDKGRPGPVCRARVNCATAFMGSGGKSMVAVGTDFGVYISEADNPRGWQRVISNPKVTQLAVLEEFSLFMLISDKSLIAYHLDVVCPPTGTPNAATSNDNARRAPQKLSGSRDVGFFATGRMKDRTLVFYKKRDVGLSSTFKVLSVLEPVLQKSSTNTRSGASRFASGILRSGKTEFFRDFDEFYIPTDCTSMNLFHSTLAISTTKGFEVLSLDKKTPISIPDLEPQHVAAIRSKLDSQKPLGMFRLSDQEFLLVYEECAVYVNKHGDISRSVIMEFVGRARAAARWGAFLVLVDDGFVEVRNLQDGRLRQVVWGRDVRLLDDGAGGGQQAGGGAGLPLGAYAPQAGRSVKLTMQHPEIDRAQIVFELVVNEGLRE